MATKKTATKKGGAKASAKSPVKRFRALVERGESGAVCAIHFPFDVEQTFGARTLKADGEARAAWDKLSYTHRREHVEHIEDAKKPETRQRRVEKSVYQLAAGK